VLIVKLQSGDALVFGGASRLLYHGVERVHPNTSPRDLGMRPGRLNLTLRQF
jgi:alkylated DNA repair protein (DNA oxidative demethylase)